MPWVADRNSIIKSCSSDCGICAETTSRDVVSAHMPQSELHDLIIELRSATQGTGSYTATFDRLQELTGRLADDVVADNNKEEAA